MNEATVIGTVVVALAIIGALVWYAVVQRRQTASLKARYGVEYDRTVAYTKDRRAAEAELVTREKRVDQLELHELTAEQRDLFGLEWHKVQEMFVDNPGRAVARADALVAEVMRARGYPVEGFEQRASDLSVHHAAFVQNYRAARDVAERHRRGTATTEELRRAMVYYRELFEDLLHVENTTRSDRPVTRIVQREIPEDGARGRATDRVQRQPVAPPPSDLDPR